MIFRAAMLVFAALLPGSAAVQDAPPQAMPPLDGAPYQPKPGEGVLCALAFHALIEEIGRQCFPGEDVEFQALIAQSVGRLDRYVLDNSDTTPAQLEAFKIKQGMKGQLGGNPERRARICQGDAGTIYRDLRSAPLPKTRQWVDTLVARPGAPAWGDCL